MVEPGLGLAEKTFAHQRRKRNTARIFVQIEQATRLPDREAQAWHFCELATDAGEERLVERDTLRRG